MSVGILYMPGLFQSHFQSHLQSVTADILSKHCWYPQLWHHIQPLLFWFSCAGPCNDEV